MYHPLEEEEEEVVLIANIKAAAPVLANYDKNDRRGTRRMQSTQQFPKEERATHYLTGE